jgi:hypothetical protein
MNLSVEEVKSDHIFYKYVAAGGLLIFVAYFAMMKKYK